jgi:hypothetical protein
MQYLMEQNFIKQIVIKQISRNVEKGTSRGAQGEKRSEKQVASEKGNRERLRKETPQGDSWPTEIKTQRGRQLHFLKLIKTRNASRCFHEKSGRRDRWSTKSLSE